MTPAYLISDDELLAVVLTDRPAGPARYSYDRCAEAIDANRGYNLVGSSSCRVSRAAKWADIERRTIDVDTAIELSPGQFWVRS